MHPAVLVGLERCPHLFLELAMLEAQLHRPIRLRFTRPAQQFDRILRPELREVQILDLVGPFDVVERHRMSGPDVDLLAGDLQLHDLLPGL